MCIRDRLGSDAPVSPPDPWLAMAAAEHRSADERDPWNAGQSLTAAQALAGSTDGCTTAVSYTHLDVYKRQAGEISMETPFCCDPVSYTHLDVYKRQAQRPRLPRSE